MDVKINVTAIHNIADLGERVNPWELEQSSKTFYEGVKVEGVENLNVFYNDESGNRVSMKASKMTERSRAVADFVVRIMERYDDYDNGRLEKHFGLTTSLANLLHDIDFFEPSNYGSDTSGFITISDIVDALAKK